MIEQSREQLMDQAIEPENKSTIGQQRASDVIFYLDTLDIINNKVKEQVSSEISNGELEKRVKKTRTLQLRESIEALAFNRVDQFLEVQPKELFEELKPKVDEARKKADSKSSRLSVIDRLKVINRVAKKFPWLSRSERAHLYEQAGYTNSEMRGVMFKAGASIPLNIGVLAIEDWLPTFIGVGEGIANPFLNADLTDPNTLLAVVASAGVYYATMAIRVHQTERFLRNGDPVIPSTTAAASYFLTEKFLEGEKKAQRWGIVMGYFANPLELIKETWIGTLFIPGVGPSIYTAGNLAAITANTALFAGLEITNRGLRLATKFRDRKNANTSGSI